MDWRSGPRKSLGARQDAVPSRGVRGVVASTTAEEIPDDERGIDRSPTGAARGG